MQRYLWVVMPALLSGCGLPPAVVIASYAADGVSYVGTGRMAFTSATSASVNRHVVARALARTCSGVVAPAMTDATAGRRASQDSANSSTERPRDSAN